MSAAPSNEVATAPAQDTTPAATETGHKIFTGNLAYATTDEGLRAFFEPVTSNIISAQVILRGTRSAGYGFVTVPTVELVQKAVAELHGKELDGRALIVEAATPAEDKEKKRTERRKKRTAGGRRGNKAPQGEVTEAEANGEAIQEATTPVEAPADSEQAKKKRTKKTRKPRNRKPTVAAEGAEGAAEPAAATESATDAAAAPKKAKRTRAPRPPRAEGEQPEGEPSKSVLFVANLAFTVDDAALADLFKEAGINVVSARVVRRRFGQPRRSKGYGFVDVGNEEEQKKALAAFEGKEVNGREIAVKVAVSAPAGSADDEDAAAPVAEEVAAH